MCKQSTETNFQRSDDPETYVPVRLTVIVPTKNEAGNLRDCLQSVSWADQVFVVDSQSVDDTVAIAEEMGAQVVQFQYCGGWPKKKNWAIRNLPIRNDWILILDADERVTADLHREIESAISRTDVDGFYVRWKFIFLGRWMKHSWSHGWMLRLLRKGHGEYEDLGMRSEGGWDNEVHENIRVSGKTTCLQSFLLHDSNQDLSFWIRKQNEFSTWNAVRRLRQLTEPMPSLRHAVSRDPLKRRKWFKALFLRLPGKPVLLFFYLFALKLGFLDGKAGLHFCALRAAHELQINAKIFEQQQSQIAQLGLSEEQAPPSSSGNRVRQ